MYGVYPFFLFSLTAFAHIFLKAHFDKKKNLYSRIKIKYGRSFL